MQMALNSVSLRGSPEGSTIVLPSNKFNKLIKLIQVGRNEIKPLKPHRQLLCFNDHWKYNEIVASPRTYQRRGKAKRVKTEHSDQEEKWTVIRKRVQAGQLALEFPQMPLVRDSLKITESPNSKLTTKIAFKSKSFLQKVGRAREERTKQVALLQKTEPMDGNMDISGWTMD